jgi:LacI family transcriptional regulator
MTTRVTQSDIARLAGVHRTTVSLALRNHPSIPLPTRQRIQTLAHHLSYRPDPGLSALMAYRNAARMRKITSTVGYVTNWTTRWGWRDVPAHGEFYEGAARRAEELGYRLEHFWFGDYVDCPDRLARVLQTRGIRGLVLASHAVGRPTTTGLNWSDLAVVKIDTAPTELPFDYVTNDQRRILQLMLRRALALGYRRIGVVLPRRWDTAAELAWSAGVFAIQARLDVADRVPTLFYETNTAANSPLEMVVPTEVLGRWLTENHPDAIVGYGEYVLPALHRLGREIPGTIGFADVLLDRGATEAAGMHQNCGRVGEVAVERVAQLLTNNNTGAPTVPVATLVEGTWQHGNTLPARAMSFDWIDDTSAPYARGATPPGC